MFIKDYILSSQIPCILFFLAVLLPLVVYNYILRKKLKYVNNKRSLMSSREELKTIFNTEENQKVLKIKKTGRDTAKRFELVTVLFSDIQGFTKIAEQLNPESLIDELDDYFYHFDSMVEKYNIEKIKTIGDAYMCAGGIPDENRTNPVEVVMAAIEMQQFMKQMKHSRGEMWDLRIGIHTGSVIAGVVGHKKISYDIWGDTVNTASRMESSCTPGRINISGECYNFVKNYFLCEYRGKMPVKYKGNVDMYYVNGIRPELNNKLNGLPLSRFDIKLQLLRIFDIEKYVLRQFERYENPDLTYHNIKNTIDLYTHAELFGKSENLTEEDMVIVLTAALLKNTGYLVSYDNHLDETLRLVKGILPKFKYLPLQVEEICQLIQNTENGRPPATAREKVLKDAVFAYLGRVDFEEVASEMYTEEKKFKQVKFEQWKSKHAEMLKNFDFSTKAASTLREVPRKTQLDNLMKMKA
jgi:adenylate cyclase